jgi:hypothetical protein
LWALDAFCKVGDHPIAPDPQRVSKDPEAFPQAGADGSFGNDASLRGIAASDWRLLDHVPSFGHAYHEA